MEASPSQQIGCSSAAEERRRQSMAADETKHRERGGEREEEEDEEEKENYVDGKGEGNLFSINSAGCPVVGPTKEEMEAVCAKGCRVLDDGRYQWDQTKLKCLLPPDECNNLLLVHNLIHGMIVSAQVHPLTLETSSEEDNEMVRLRSLPFFNQLLAGMENGMSKYQSLSGEQTPIVAVGVRDLFLGASHGLLNDQEKRILDGMVKMLDEPAGCFEAMGMNISFHPSANFKVFKLIEALDDDTSGRRFSLR